MAVWKLHGNGTIAPGAVVAPDERLGWGKTFGLGAQHVVAMFGATFLVPLITGFPIPATLFFSGVGTLLFLLITGNRLPSYLGSSFAFIAPVMASKMGDDIGKALFGIMFTGILLAIVGAVVHLAGSKWIDALMPPVMTGTIVMLIGFNLAGAAWGKANNSGFWAAPVTGWITLIAIVLITVGFRGLIGRLSILLGVLVGYIAALFQGQVSFTEVNKAAWLGLPQFTLPTVDFNVTVLFLPVVLVLIAENVGHVKSVALMTGQNYDKTMGRALLADGVATTLAGFGGGSGTTTYAENIGVMAATKVYSTAALLGGRRDRDPAVLHPEVRPGGRHHPRRCHRCGRNRALRHDRPAGGQDLDRQQGGVHQAGEPDPGRDRVDHGHRGLHLHRGLDDLRRRDRRHGHRAGALPPDAGPAGGSGHRIR